MTYSVKEIFLTLQGEGGQAGKAAVFCRFAGCNLWSGREQDRAAAACDFCDTDFVGTDGEGGGKFSDAASLAQAVLAAWTGGRVVGLAGLAMTLAALILGNRFFARNLSTRLKYATLGVLFVNISVGGTLTSFAAPPVLMVAAKWNWDTAFMIANFGWKAALAVAINAGCATLLFRRELGVMGEQAKSEASPVPPPVVARCARAGSWALRWSKCCGSRKK